VSTAEFDTKASAETMMRGRYNALMQTKTKFVFDLGNGHMAYDYPSTHGRPFAQWHPTWDAKYKSELEAVFDKAVARVGPERARKMAHFDHHILIFPNLAIVDNHGIMIRTYFSKKPAEMLVQSWTLAPQENRRRSGSCGCTATWTSSARPVSARRTTWRRSKRHNAATRARRITAAGTTSPPALARRTR
jgi:hypothetical protein